MTSLATPVLPVANDVLRFLDVRSAPSMGLVMHLEKRAQAERDTCEIKAAIRTVETSLSCLVVDLTEQGAGLSLDAVTELPSRFHLALPLLDEHVDERLVELRWHQGLSAGVRFIKA